MYTQKYYNFRIDREARKDVPIADPTRLEMFQIKKYCNIEYWQLCSVNINI